MPRWGLTSGKRSSRKRNPGFSSVAVRWSWISLSPRTRSKVAIRISVSRFGVSIGSRCEPRWQFEVSTLPQFARDSKFGARAAVGAPIGFLKVRRTARALPSGPVVPITRKRRTGRQNPAVFKGSGRPPVQLRRATLYPAELRVQWASFSRLVWHRQRPWGQPARLRWQGQGPHSQSKI